MEADHHRPGPGVLLSIVQRLPGGLEENLGPALLERGKVAEDHAAGLHPGAFLQSPALRPQRHPERHLLRHLVERPQRLAQLRRRLGHLLLDVLQAGPQGGLALPLGLKIPGRRPDAEQ